MARRPESMSRLRDGAFAARLFLIVAGLALAAALALLARNQGLFTDTVKVHFFAGTAEGLHRGMAVKLVGFKVGFLDTVGIDGGLRVRATLKIDQRYADTIDRDATVKVTKENIIGAGVIEVWPGNGDLGPIKDGSELRYEREPSIETAVNALVAQAMPIVAEVRQLAAYLNDNQGDFRTVMASLNTTTASLAAVSSDLKRYAASAGARIDSTAAKADAAIVSADTLLKETRATLKVVDGAVRHVDTALPGITMKVEQTLDSVREVTKAALGLVSHDMVTLVSEGGELVASSRETMGDARRSWPLRDMVERPETRVLKLDSGGGLFAVPVDGPRAR